VHPKFHQYTGCRPLLKKGRQVIGGFYQEIPVCICSTTIGIEEEMSGGVLSKGLFP
jgi:hypothetical protein